MKKKTFLILILLGMEVLLLGIFTNQKEQEVEVFNIDAQTEEEIKDELIIAVFIENIEKAVKEYYKYNLSRDVAVYDYETDIMDIKKLNGGLIQIKFGVTPQVGAHNPIGYDELTYTINSSGQKQFTDYQHVKNYSVNR